MKKNLLAFLFLIYSIAVLCQTKKSNLTGAGFTAEFNSDVVPEKTFSEMQFGQIESTTYSYEGADFLILISENIYPAELINKLKKVGADGLLDGSKNGAIKNLELQTGEKFVLKFDEKFLYEDKYPAIKFGGSASEAQLQSLCILKENHFFIIMTIGNSQSPEVLKFLNSFKLL